MDFSYHITIFMKLNNYFNSECHCLAIMFHCKVWTVSNGCFSTPGMFASTTSPHENLM